MGTSGTVSGGRPRACLTGSALPNFEALEAKAVSTSTKKSFVITSSRSNIRRQPWIFDPANVTRGIDDPIDKLKALPLAGRHCEVARWAAKNEITRDDFDSHEYCHGTTWLLSECSA